ncbi:MFS transporter [Candidatus Poriferisocius sp.]|uniref:MFS transporter n=1 Tax=Candidatus Poriferisocius sp. TaxID=3101276 RepID=UPI003B01BB8E
MVEPVERRSWLALGAATAAAFMVVVDVSIVNVAFPSIQKSLDASNAALSWIVSGYSITVGSFLLLSGRLADRQGRRKMFNLGLVIFAVGSLFCGIAPQVEVLIAARVVQALGGSLIMPSSLAMVLPEFPVSRRSAAIGMWGAMGALGAAFGPSIGALLINGLGWRWIFYVNLPIAALVFAATARLVRESRDEDTEGRLDVVGVPVGTLALALVMVAIVQGEGWGYGDYRIIVFAVVGVVLLPLVIWRSRSHPNPLLDLSLFSYRSFSAATASFGLYALGFVPGFLMSSLLLQDLWGLTVLEAGLGLTPGPIMASALSVPIGRMADRWGHRWLLTSGVVLCGVSYALLLVWAGESSAYFSVFLPANVLLGIGVGLSIATFVSAAMSDVPPPRFAIANATTRTVQQVCFALGIAVVIALFNSAPSGDPLSGFQRAWIWVIATYAASALVIMVAFPSGTALLRGGLRGGQSGVRR